MPLTPARQRNAVSEGTALGLLRCGRDALTYDKVRIDLAFEGAWRSWAYRPEFPRVSTDLEKGLDAVHALTHADAGRRVYALYWERDRGELRIRRRGGWDVEDAEDVEYAASMIDGDVPLEGWQSLAAAFLRRFDR